MDKLERNPQDSVNLDLENRHAREQIREKIRQTKFELGVFAGLTAIIGTLETTILAKFEQFEPGYIKALVQNLPQEMLHFTQQLLHNPENFSFTPEMAPTALKTILAIIGLTTAGYATIVISKAIRIKALNLKLKGYEQ
jgi:hypothetical protein